MIKRIIYSNIDEDDKITRKIERAKLFLINSKDEILLAYMNKNYQLPGGHVEEYETLDDCLIREVREETGIELPIEKRNPFIIISYETKNYPESGINSLYVANYYFMRKDYIPDMDNTNLTQDEINGDFKLEFIHKDKVLDVLRKSISSCTRKKVVRDTIDVIEAYIDMQEEGR